MMKTRTDKLLEHSRDARRLGPRERAAKMNLPSLAGAASKAVFDLSPQKPFRLDLTVWALRRRPDNVVDLWDGRYYRRLLEFYGVPTQIQVLQTGPSNHPCIRVNATARGFVPDLQQRVVQALNRILGLNINLSPFYKMARRDPKIGGLVERFFGVKPPRFPSVFEALLNAVACQQLTVLVGILLLNRLATRWGFPAEDSTLNAYAFPSARRLSAIKPPELRALGFSRQKALTVLRVARAYVDHPSRFEALQHLAGSEAVERLLTLKGIGRWSAEYVMLRGLGRLDVFPADDVAGQKNLYRRLNLRKVPDYEKSRRLLSKWHPYEGLLYFHFLLAGLEERGILSPLGVAAPSHRSTPPEAGAIIMRKEFLT